MNVWKGYSLKKSTISSKLQNTTYNLPDCSVQVHHCRRSVSVTAPLQHAKRPRCSSLSTLISVESSRASRQRTSTCFHVDPRLQSMPRLLNDRQTEWAKFYEVTWTDSVADTVISSCRAPVGGRQSFERVARRDRARCVYSKYFWTMEQCIAGTNCALSYRLDTGIQLESMKHDRFTDGISHR